MTFTSDTFRRALSLFPTGVAIVTTRSPDGERIGVTVSSFNSVSLAPPLVLFSIARTARSIEAWNAAETYAVNVLAEDQSDVSSRFARASADKWSGIGAAQDDIGSPTIPDALATFQCRSYARYDGGDHLILVGEVTGFSHPASGAPRPLLFFRGRYRQLDPERLIDTPPGMEHYVHGW
jgi:flavin reductase (DIM6/NTAB) family NADH-FMN oxidoreductase RutF